MRVSPFPLRTVLTLCRAATSHLAPSGTFVASTTGVGGVPQATAVPANTTTTDATPVVSSAVRAQMIVMPLWGFCALALGLYYL